MSKPPVINTELAAEGARLAAAMGAADTMTDALTDLVLMLADIVATLADDAGRNVDAKALRDQATRVASAPP